MPQRMHPETILFQGEAAFPILPAVDHYAGSEKLIRKAMRLQEEIGPYFDITCDCEDGARAGAEADHAHLCADLISDPGNLYGRMGVRIHDITHPHWEDDLNILLARADSRLAFVTLPKPRSAADVRQQLDTLHSLETAHGIGTRIPVHVLIETHGALRDVREIAALPGVESIDFGLMDFVSAHHGAIPGSAMRSPGQFEHPLIVRAKCEISAAALGAGVVPSHNVTTELKDIDYIRHDAERARREFGYMRMWSIHPNQIQPILDAMRPDFREVSEAAEIVCAAQDADWGPIQHAGKLHDRASYRYYWELLKRARATGVELETGIAARFFP
ncbi:MAG: CoA ester lyase [Rhodocyclaceae bacterium]|nr:CoA ester lyase [Rhodocyclaceae bacterium]MCP5311579.1 CoA ester lyase [Zoogloeaceae bacterium]